MTLEGTTYILSNSKFKRADLRILHNRYLSNLQHMYHSACIHKLFGT